MKNIIFLLTVLNVYCVMDKYLKLNPVSKIYIHKITNQK
jgi:hypothetical protein